MSAHIYIEEARFKIEGKLSGMPPRDTAGGKALCAEKAAFTCAPRGSRSVSVLHGPHPGSSARALALAKQECLC